VLFPHSDLRTAKLRPALIIQADNLNTGLSQVIVAMITSRLFRANHPSRVIILRSTPEGQQSGLLTTQWSWPTTSPRLPSLRSTA